MVLALIIMAFMPMTAIAADESTTTTITMDGPTTLGIGAKQPYMVNTIGGSDQSTNASYSWTVVLGGKMASLAQLPPANGKMKLNGSFFFNLTAPTSPGDFSVTITVRSDSTNLSNSQEVDMKAIEPIVLSATLKNGGNVTVNGVPVYFYLNDDPVQPTLIYDTVVNMTGLQESKVTYNWTSFNLSKGQHEILVVIDPNNQTVSLENGATQMSQTIYFGATGYGDSNAWLWAFVVTLVVLLYMVYRRPAKRKKKKKK
jgi:hypothetical protein